MVLTPSERAISSMAAVVFTICSAWASLPSTRWLAVAWISVADVVTWSVAPCTLLMICRSWPIM